MEEKKTIPVTPPVTAARRVFPVDGRDRALLVLAWGVGVLCAEVLLWGLSGLGMTLLVAAWYGVLFWYGGAAPLARRENRLLLYAVGLLALTFALFANPWLRLWNTLTLVLLMGIQMGGWPGMEVYPVETSAMLGERFLRVMGGLFGYLGASVQALGSIRGLSRKKMPYVLGALLVCVPLLMVVFPLLTSADALFAQVTRRAADWFDEHLALWALRLIFGLLVAPFLFGLLYSLRRPEPLKRPARPVEGLSMEAAGPVTVLAVLDVLYAFFLAVQCAALFGGADYLAQVGISYASYARSGFFQLVAVAAVNLACLLACLALCKGEGRGLRMVQVLGTLLVAASGVLLVSALWRMNLYVGAYGLSFKRALTYWGMAVLAVLLAAALWKVWHRHFHWFRVLLSVGAAGWLLLNYATTLAAAWTPGRSSPPRTDGWGPCLRGRSCWRPSRRRQSCARRWRRFGTAPGGRPPIGRPGRWPLGGGSSRNENRPDSVCRPGGRPSAQRGPVQKKVKRPLAYTVPAPSSTVMDTRQVVRPRCSTRARAVT